MASVDRGSRESDVGVDLPTMTFVDSFPFELRLRFNQRRPTVVLWHHTMEQDQKFTKLEEILFKVVFLGIFDGFPIEEYKAEEPRTVVFGSLGVYRNSPDEVSRLGGEDELGSSGKLIESFVPVGGGPVLEFEEDRGIGPVPGFGDTAVG